MAPSSSFGGGARQELFSGSSARELDASGATVCGHRHQCHQVGRGSFHKVGISEVLVEFKVQVTLGLGLEA